MLVNLNSRLAVSRGWHIFLEEGSHEANKFMIWPDIVYTYEKHLSVLNFKYKSSNENLNTNKLEGSSMLLNGLFGKDFME